MKIQKHKKLDCLYKAFLILTALWTIFYIVITFILALTWWPKLVGTTDFLLSIWQPVWIVSLILYVAYIVLVNLKVWKQQFANTKHKKIYIVKTILVPIFLLISIILSSKELVQGPVYAKHWNQGCFTCTLISSISLMIFLVFNVNETILNFKK